MSSLILVSMRPSGTRVAVIENDVLTDFMMESSHKRGYAGSVYKGKVLRILPGMQAAFVDIGLERAAFLYVGDVIDQSAEDASIFLEADGGPPEPTGGEMVNVESKRDTEKPRAQIQDLLTEGQFVLVQVAKDPLGTKGARVTTHLSLPGRHVVFMPSVSHLGISRRIEDEAERDRLRDILERHKPTEGGIIVRTAGEQAPEEAIKADIEYLSILYSEIQKEFKRRRNVGLVHTELDVELRAIRDFLTEDVEEILVDDYKAYKRAAKFTAQFMPRLKNRVKHHKSEAPLFDLYNVDLEVSRSLGRKVWLKSGGYIIIDEAEALVVIDVNTGSYVGKKDLEETILKTNLEAVKEIAHQLRIRNCGGIIIIDFIDMERVGNREKVMEALKDELKKDRARTTLSEMSSLGLVEMTRKRIRPSLVKSLCEPCFYCEGRGYVKSKATISQEVFFAVEREMGKKVRRNSATRISCHPELAAWIFDEESETLEFMEKRYGVTLQFVTSNEFHIEEYEISSLAIGEPADPPSGTSYDS
ncbi:MAG: Rne/Rng family ribonuclease [Bdellovibrionales bacterium CG10_big_fil_rev_8_21_14_0_10_45_34]|nr:MAG: Rne/Rng family ribonuclease [Bdellovibrionales bacterium CG10_big_fil_rev_8_21_14_0_10_45_34]